MASFVARSKSLTGVHHRTATETATIAVAATERGTILGHVGSMTKVRVPEPGEVLGQNYLLEKEIGRGGFGVVFKARHIDIDRVVAIKVLLATYALKDPRAKDRFKREATIAASLDYPNSLRIFDYGETEEGVFYIVMEYVQGKDLGKLLESAGRIAIPRAIHIIRQVLHALMEAHARGIVHRDIKPDNVMLCPLAYDPDYVKVMDFGIAKMVDSDEQITNAGITLGTPRYMPVEQLKGERLGPATDLYAVGLVLYEMLVGAPAFQGDTAVDTAVAVMQGGPVEVPADAPVPEPLRKLIGKACARHQEDRFQSARAFLEALNELDPALLDVDRADLERFAADASKRPTPAKKRPTTAELRIQAEPIAPGKDFEDAIATQAISTDALLAAAPPRRSAEAAQEAFTEAAHKAIAAATQEGGAAAAQEASTVAVQIGEVAQATAPRAPAGETSMVASVGLAAPRPRPKFWAGTPPLLVGLNAAILIVVLIILLRI